MTPWGRLNATAAELERCRLWILETFGVAGAAGDTALQDYVVDVAILWDRLSTLARAWRHWGAWQKPAAYRDGYRLRVGYRPRRPARVRRAIRGVRRPGAARHRR